MNKNSGALLRDIRNMKRNYTMTQKQMILSAKQLKKARSSQQIQLNQFLQTKNDKIRNIDQRLHVHQSQIQRNNSIITDLTNNFLSLKDQMVKQKQKNQNQERRNKLLREQVQRTNKIMRTKNLKIDQLGKKIQNIQKQNQIFKGNALKLQESLKQNQKLRKQINTLEDNLNQKKIQINQKEKQIQKLKEGNTAHSVLKNKEQYLLKDLQSKNLQILQLNNQIVLLNEEKKQESIKRIAFQDKVKSLEKKIQTEKHRCKEFDSLYNQYKKNYQDSQKKLYALEAQQNTMNTRIKSQEGYQLGLRNQLQQYRNKFDQIQKNLSKSKNDIFQKDQLLQGLRKKLTQLQTNQMSSQRQISDMKLTSNKMQTLKKKSKNLQQLYKNMIPQIQCPFGHELNNPVTIIPCGHNYCLGCKKGYTKQCMMCNGKLKIEAVYRNELMDDIIGIINGIRQIIQIIK